MKLNSGEKIFTALAAVFVFIILLLKLTGQIPEDVAERPEPISELVTNSLDHPTSSDPATSQSESKAIQAASSKNIPGANPVDIYLSLEERGFKTTKEVSPYGMTWLCSGGSEWLKMEAEINSSEPDQIEILQASVLTDAVNATAQDGKEFIAFIASFPYDGANPKWARNWVLQNYNTDNATTMIGQVRFTLRAPSVAYRTIWIERE